jgi:ATP-binding cassette subfamily B protein
MLNSQPTRFRLILSYITPHRRVLLAVLGLLLAGSLLALANPWMSGLLIRSVVGDIAGQDTQPMDSRLLLGLWLGLLPINAVLAFASQYYIGATGERITALLRNRLYQHLQALPVG